jgi:hypothetical protein
MSNDYALFIIIVPNDFDVEKSVIPPIETTNAVKPQSRKVSNIM